MGDSYGNPRLPSRAIRSSFGMRRAAEDAASGALLATLFTYDGKDLAFTPVGLFVDEPADGRLHRPQSGDSLADALAPKAAAK